MRLTHLRDQPLCGSRGLLELTHEEGSFWDPSISKFLAGPLVFGAFQRAEEAVSISHLAKTICPRRRDRWGLFQDHVNYVVGVNYTYTYIYIYKYIYIYISVYAVLWVLFLGYFTGDRKGQTLLFRGGSTVRPRICET